MILYIDQPPHPHWPTLIDFGELIQEQDDSEKKLTEAVDEQDGWYNEQEF